MGIIVSNLFVLEVNLLNLFTYNSRSIHTNNYSLILIGIKDYNTKKTRAYFNRLFCKSYQYKLFVPHVYIRLLNQYSNTVWYNTRKNIHTDSRPQIYMYI